MVVVLWVVLPAFHQRHGYLCRDLTWTDVRMLWVVCCLLLCLISWWMFWWTTNVFFWNENRWVFGLLTSQSVCTRNQYRTALVLFGARVSTRQYLNAKGSAHHRMPRIHPKPQQWINMYTHRIHVWYIYLHVVVFFMVNVGEYAIYGSYGTC